MGFFKLVSQLFRLGLSSSAQAGGFVSAILVQKAEELF